LFAFAAPSLAVGMSSYGVGPGAVAACGRRCRRQGCPAALLGAVHLTHPPTAR
jgi:hypothetical protein